MTYFLKTEFDGTLLTNQMLTIIIDLIYKFIIYLLQQLLYYHKRLLFYLPNVANITQMLTFQTVIFLDSNFQLFIK